jgi:cytochrome c oxidase assembly protein subunit 15
MSQAIVQNDSNPILAYFSDLLKTDSKSFQQTYKWLCIEILFLICLGGAVRAMNAGLACPDWPLCFGDYIPDYHPQVYLEFLHRVLAGFIALFSIFLNWRIIKSDFSKGTKYIAGLIIIILIAQIIMGGLTVLLQLHEYVVAAHLGLGTLFFALSFWVFLSVREKNAPSEEKQTAEKQISTKRSIKNFGAFIQLCLVFAQIMLGGLVASHYAAQVCTEFPLCHGQWVPTLSGVIGLHVIHRLGAYVLFTYTLVFSIYLISKKQYPALKKWGFILLILIFTQMFLGISNVLLMTPPLITVLHLLFGTLLLGAATRIFFEYKNAGVKTL